MVIIGFQGLAKMLGVFQSACLHMGAAPEASVLVGALGPVGGRREDLVSFSVV